MMRPFVSEWHRFKKRVEVAADNLGSSVSAQSTVEAAGSQNNAQNGRGGLLF